MFQVMLCWCAARFLLYAFFSLFFLSRGKQCKWKCASFTPRTPLRVSAFDVHVHPLTSRRKPVLWLFACPRYWPSALGKQAAQSHCTGLQLPLSSEYGGLAGVGSLFARRDTFQLSLFRVHTHAKGLCPCASLKPRTEPGGKEKIGTGFLLAGWTPVLVRRALPPADGSAINPVTLLFPFLFAHGVLPPVCLRVFIRLSACSSLRSGTSKYEGVGPGLGP